MKRYLLAIVLLLPFILQAKVAVEKPRSKQPTAFAIVVDQATYDKTAPQIHAYRDVLEADGLSTYILRDNWQTPEQVREQLIALMRKTAKRSPLEGVVFVGDIPIAMVRNAQHLTTAFKMDEDNFPMIQSSVPSDRYYDCPDLQFELIARDTTDRLLSYFNLACDSPQRLDPAFYSGRIRYPEQLGGDKYEGIARYLEKVVAERGKVDQLDNLVTYAGDGYNSDCLVCWMDERVAIDENFPLTDTRKAGNLRQLNFRMDDYMKYRVFDELVRPEVDAMFFNEHGSPDKQHVGSYTTEPDSFDGQYSQLKAEVMIALYMERRKGDKADVEGAKQYFKEKYHLTDAFFETKKTEADDDTKAKGDQTIVSLEDLETLAAQPRFVMLNACYNGSFHKPGYITGYYIFGPGRTVATQGNTVNVLQDRWTYELVGLLSHGVRVGQYNPADRIARRTHHRRPGLPVPARRAEYAGHRHDNPQGRRRLLAQPARKPVGRRAEPRAAHADRRRCDLGGRTAGVHETVAAGDDPYGVPQTHRTLRRRGDLRASHHPGTERPL